MEANLAMFNSRLSSTKPLPMRVVGVVAGLIILAAHCAGQAQSTIPSAPAAKQGPGQSQARYTIQTRVPLTILDVVVTDSKARPVHGLKQSDFTVLEDGQK